MYIYVFRVIPSGFGGLEVSVLAFGTQDRRFKAGRSPGTFRAKKSSARLPSDLRRGSKAVGPMS